MEIWEHLEITRKPEWKSGLNNKDIIHSLQELSIIGTPSVIEELIPLLLYHSKEIRTAAITTIHTLSLQLKNKNILYSSLKHSPIHIEKFKWYEEKFDKKEYRWIMQIASLNRNGYVREKAVIELGKLNHGESIPFILFRLSDWVKVVRSKAIHIFNTQFIRKEFVDNLVINLSIITQFDDIHRTDLSQIKNDILHFLIHDQKEEISKKFKKHPEKERRILAQNISEKNFEKRDFELFLSDKHFLIRILCLNHFDLLSATQNKSLLEDKSGKIRMATLDSFNKNDTEFSKILPSFIADTSGTVRQFAKYYLKNSNLNFEEIYLENLENNKQIIGSLLGLREMNAKEHTEKIASFLEHSSIRVIKTAFYVLSKLDRDKAYHFALQNLDTERVGIRNKVLDFLKHYPTPEVISKSRKIFYESDDEKLQLDVLKLFGKIGGYKIISDLIKGSISENKKIRILAANRIQQWKKDRVNTYTNPKQMDIEKAKNIYNIAFDIHEEKKYFKKNPLQDLDFFLNNK